MSDDLYTQDILIWSERQADLLARLARGERVNDAVDWPNVIEELQDVGRSELHSCESLLRQALVHLLKIRAWPEGPVDHWSGEVVNFLVDAQKRFSPSMRQKIDIAQLFGSALQQVAQTKIDGRAAAADVPIRCALTITDLLANPVQVAHLVARLG